MSTGGDTGHTHAHAVTSSQVVRQDFCHVFPTQKLVPDSVYQPRQMVVVHAILCFCDNNVTSRITTTEENTVLNKHTKRQTVFYVSASQLTSHIKRMCNNWKLLHSTHIIQTTGCQRRWCQTDQQNIYEYISVCNFKTAPIHFDTDILNLSLMSSGKFDLWPWNGISMLHFLSTASPPNLNFVHNYVPDGQASMAHGEEQWYADHVTLTYDLPL